MRFEDGIRTRFPQHQERFDALEGFFSGYDERFVRRLIPRPNGTQDRGYRAAHLLLTSLCRARLLTATTIQCANSSMVLGMYLATRAHWEMAGLGAHLLRALRRLYSEEISEPEFDDTLRRLILGRRWDVPTDIQADVQAINAVTLVESAAKLLQTDDVEEFVRECYAVLSEHCHPNLLGRLSGVTLMPGGLIECDPAFTITELDMSTCLTHGLPSQAIFTFAYDECFRLLHQFEGMPVLEAGSTKNGEGREATCPPELRALLGAQVERVRGLSRQLGRVLGDLFPHLDGRWRGQRRRDFRKAWRAAFQAAGVPGLLKHDMRRSAVRNLVRAGVSEHVAMSISGHKTRSVFDRYDIVSEADRVDAAAKLAAFQAQAVHTSVHTR